MRTIKDVKVAEQVNMGGIIIDQALPIGNVESVDPFLLIHHWKSKLPGNQEQKEVGVGPHPHRGFSPVTIILNGSLHHRDSLGNNSIVDKGGVQWMNAGKGVTHSERPSESLAKNGGEFEIIQFWVNTQSSLKLLPASYYAIHNNAIPELNLGKNISLKLISGEFDGTYGPNNINNHINVFRLTLGEGTETQFSIPLNHQVLVYQIEGLSTINDKSVPMDKSIVLFENDNEFIKINAKKNSEYLVLSAEPLNEKVSQYGPFVMNNTTEIMEAIRDAQMGKMGILIEEFN